MRAVFPRYARKNRTQMIGKYHAAAGRKCGIGYPVQYTSYAVEGSGRHPEVPGLPEISLGRLGGGLPPPSRPSLDSWRDFVAPNLPKNADRVSPVTYRMTHEY